MSVELGNNYQVSSRLVSNEPFSGAPYAMSDAFARGLAPKNPIVSRIANAAAVGAIPGFIQELTAQSIQKPAEKFFKAGEVIHIPGHQIGLGTRHILGGASNAIGATSHFMRAAKELLKGNRDDAMLSAARSVSQAYSTIMNGLVIGGLYFVSDLPMIELAASVIAPNISRSFYRNVNEAPNDLIARAFGVKKPYVIRIEFENGTTLKLPISREEKEKIERGQFKYYSIEKTVDNGYEIKFHESAPVDNVHVRSPRQKSTSRSRVRRSCSGSPSREPSLSRSPSLDGVRKRSKKRSK